MSINTSIIVNENSTHGFKVTVRDVDSSIVVPSSMTYHVRNSLNTIIGSGQPSALSSETYITLNSSFAMVYSGEVRASLKRNICIDSRYTSDKLGANAIEKETFEYTLVNNPIS